MARPDDISEALWAKVERLPVISENFDEGDMMIVARAILAAVEEERATAARFASAGMIREGRDEWAKGYRCAAADIYEAIRNRKGA